MSHSTLTDDIRTTAALYSLGALSAEEMRSFEHHIEGCEVCRDEARSFDSSVAQLPLAVLEIEEPPPHLRDRVLSAIEDAPSGVQVVRSTEGVWKRTPFPGVTVKSLHFDPATGMMTNLL